jgi:hypothetical protein
MILTIILTICIYYTTVMISMHDYSSDFFTSNTNIEDVVNTVKEYDELIDQYSVIEETLMAFDHGTYREEVQCELMSKIVMSKNKKQMTLFEHLINVNYHHRENKDYLYVFDPKLLVDCAQSVVKNMYAKNIHAMNQMLSGLIDACSNVPNKNTSEDPCVSYTKIRDILKKELEERVRLRKKMVDRNILGALPRRLLDEYSGYFPQVQEYGNNNNKNNNIKAGGKSKKRLRNKKHKSMRLKKRPRKTLKRKISKHKK